MTDTPIDRIRTVAEAGREVAQDNESPYDEDDPCRELRENFESILHNVKRLESTMHDTDPTDGAQWWEVEHDDYGVWHVDMSVMQQSSSHDTNVSAYRIAGRWTYKARVYCPRAEAEQAAVEAWREAGFAHAPQEAPGPKQVEVVGYGVYRRDRPLEGARQITLFDQPDSARHYLAGLRNLDYRIVKVAATISECEGE